MCGIAGYLGDFDSELLPIMATCLAHRGQDDEGVWYNEETGVGLAQRRLSILDLSLAGHQPMWDSARRAVIVYNGEIYNFRELRGELEAKGYRFRSQTDSEVLVNLYLDQGPEMLSYLNGIFAFAIWDVMRGELFLARDPLGVKPLYYAETLQGVFFASELKALLCFSELDRTLDLNALRAYLTFLWAPGALTMFKGVRKLLPGEAMVLHDGRRVRRWRYQATPFVQPIAQISAADSLEELRWGLREAVRRQMVADVPVGAFLSGGLDSSTVVYFAREHAKGRLDCFTIASKGGYGEEGAEDYPYAQMMAKALNVRLHTVWVGPEMADRVEEMVWHLDEPQPDPAALNVRLISELARSMGIKVLLSGAGGDDLFTGYRRHAALTYEKYWAWMPARVRRGLANGMAHLNHSRPLGRRLARLFTYAGLEPTERLLSYFFWMAPELVDQLFAPDVRRELTATGPASILRDTLGELPTGTPSLNQMLYLELRHFLADHNLNYTDKMSMASGVEVRVPFLDRALVDFAARLPVNFKQRGRTGKWILRETMRSLLPDDVITRPKTGFGAPLRGWLRNELRPLVRDVLSEEAIRRRGIFDPAAVQTLIEADAGGHGDAAYTIFGLMCVELWSRQFLDRVPGHARAALA